MSNKNEIKVKKKKNVLLKKEAPRTFVAPEELPTTPSTLGLLLEFIIIGSSDF